MTEEPTRTITLSIDEYNRLKEKDAIRHRRVKRQPTSLDDESVTKIAEWFLTTDEYAMTAVGEFLRLRDAYAWLLMNALGLRPMECLSLKWSDIDFQERKVTLSPYWNKQRIDIPAILTQPAMKLILEYREKLSKLDFHCKYLFPSNTTHEPVSSGNFARRFLTAAKRCGIAKVAYHTNGGQPKYNIRPYTGRHNFCTKIWKATHDTTCVQKLARHLKLESAQSYIHVDTSDKIQIADEVFSLKKEGDK